MPRYVVTVQRTYAVVVDAPDSIKAMTRAEARENSGDTSVKPAVKAVSASIVRPT